MTWKCVRLLTRYHGEPRELVWGSLPPACIRCHHLKGCTMVGNVWLRSDEENQMFIRLITTPAVKTVINTVLSAADTERERNLSLNDFPAGM